MTVLKALLCVAVLSLTGCQDGPVPPSTHSVHTHSVHTQVKARVSQIAFEAFTHWALKNVDKECPASLQELTPYLANPTLQDPWGNELVMACGDSSPAAAPFGVLSVGPDGKPGSADDIRSWE